MSATYIPPVINDLTTGGTTASLSAQQGVVLKSAVDTNTTAIATKAADSSVVHLAGTETVTGAKTFSATINGSISGNAAGLSSVLAVASGGTGTTSPSLVAGTNVTITGTWPNQTVAATGGGGGAGSPGGSSSQVQYNNSGAFGGAAALTYATSGSLLTVTAQTGSDMPLLVKATSGQSVSLQEWQNSGGGVVARVDSAGSFLTNASSITQAQFGTSLPFYVMANNPTLGLNAYYSGGWKYGTNGYAAAVDFAANYNGAYTFYSTSTTGSSGASAGLVPRFTSFPNGHFTFGSVGSDLSGTLAVQTDSSSTVASVVKGAGGQTANLQEWQDSSATPMVAVDASGRMAFGRLSSVAPKVTALLDSGYVDSTDSTRKGYIDIQAADFSGTNRTGMRVASDGTQAKIGFYGATPVAQAATPTTLAQVITILQNLGLCA